MTGNSNGLSEFDFLDAADGWWTFLTLILTGWLVANLYIGQRKGNLDIGQCKGNLDRQEKELAMQMVGASLTSWV